MTDLTHTRLLRIAAPIVISNATVPLLGAVDTGVVGQLGQAAPIGAVGIGVSSSEAKRKIQDGGVRLDGEKLLDPNQLFAGPEELDGKVLQLGRKTFRRLVAP